MFCQKCGSKLKDKALFCTECGAKVEDEKKTTDAAEAKPVEPVSKPLENPTPQAMPATVGIQKQKTSLSKKQKVSLISIIAVAVVLVVAVILVIALQPTKDAAQQEAATQSEPESSAQKQTEDQAATQSKYILENSATKELTDADIASLTDDEICIAQNEIWARHGRKFKNNWLQEYFNKQSWYSGTIEADEFLNKYSPTDIENKNAQFLNSALSSRGYELNKAHPNESQTSSTSGDVATLTQELKNDGYNLVLQGEVRIHDDYSYNTSTTTPYIRLNEFSEIKGYQAGEYRVRNTQTICPSSSYQDGSMSSEQILSYCQSLNGRQVLIGINNDSYDIQFFSDAPCSLQLHTKEECDLLNFGHPVRVTNFEIKDLN